MLSIRQRSRIQSEIKRGRDVGGPALRQPGEIRNSDVTERRSRLLSGGACGQSHGNRSTVLRSGSSEHPWDAGRLSSALVILPQLRRHRCQPRPPECRVQSMKRRASVGPEAVISVSSAAPPGHRVPSISPGAVHQQSARASQAAGGRGKPEPPSTAWIAGRPHRSHFSRAGTGGTLGRSETGEQPVLGTSLRAVPGISVPVTPGADAVFFIIQITASGPEADFRPRRPSRHVQEGGGQPGPNAGSAQPRAPAPASSVARQTIKRIASAAAHPVSALAGGLVQARTAAELPPAPTISADRTTIAPHAGRAATSLTGWPARRSSYSRRFFLRHLEAALIGGLRRAGGSDLVLMMRAIATFHLLPP